MNELRNIYNFPSTTMNDGVDDMLDVLHGHQVFTSCDGDELMLMVVTTMLSVAHASGFAQAGPNGVVEKFKQAITKLMNNPERILE